jgi:cephalosporin hydroxylase
MNEEKEFRAQCAKEIEQQGTNKKLKSITQEWMKESIQTNYSYHFEWLGRPIIQYPQDIVGTQQLLWNVKPDLIIETGIARGGSVIFYASILELIAQCGGPVDASVLGIDIDIRAHNKEEILAHPMSKRIEMIEGSSIDSDIFQQVKNKAQGKQRVLVCLDSNHTHEHVLEELNLYSSLVSIGSYIVVFDTVVEDLSSELIKNRPWSKGNNPKTAVHQFIKTTDRFEIDESVHNKLLITVAPDGYLKCVK